MRQINCSLLHKLLSTVAGGEVGVFSIKERGSPKSCLSCQKCAKTHLRASVVHKKIFRLAIARHCAYAKWSTSEKLFCSVTVKLMCRRN
jgi:hypothetical protein